MQSLPPPHVFVDNTAQCADAQNATDQVGKITSETTAPDSWVVAIAIRTNPANSGELLGVGEIRNGDGVRVAVRELSALTPNTCTPLARSLGLWATIVLEGRFRGGEAAPVASVPTPDAAVLPEGATLPSGPEKGQPDAGPAPVRFGVAAAMITDTQLDLLLGPSVSVALETNDVTVIRPHLMLGFPAVNFSVLQKQTIAGAIGVDACGRVPGGPFVRFEECGVLQLDFGATFNSAHTPDVAPAVGFGQGVTFNVADVYRIEARARALINVSLVNEKAAVSPLIIQTELGFSWPVK